MEDSSVTSFKQKVSGYDFIRFTVCDMFGRSRCKIVPARNASKLINKGTEVWIGMVAMGPSYEAPMGLKHCMDWHQGNAALVPVVDTLYDVPWSADTKYKTGSVLCETRFLDGTPQEACPRLVARRQLERLRDMGYTILSGIENEFILFQKGTRIPAFEGSPIFATVDTAQHESFLHALDKALHKAGVNIDALQTEYSPGQFEVTCEPKFGIETADHMFIFREAVKEIALHKGYDYSFMSKPSTQTGNGSHLNISLWDAKGEKNVFYDEDKPDKLSDILRYWIGGLIKHIGAVTAVCSPTVNCYRRLHTPWAPDLANWGIEDRMAAYRVKKTSPKSTLVENRIPSGSSNPYLTIAVTVAAGMDGIKNKIEPPPMYQQDAPRLADNLEETLKMLEEDKVIVDALGPQFIEWFIEPKREFDLKNLSGFDPKVFTEDRQEKERLTYSSV